MEQSPLPPTMGALHPLGRERLGPKEAGRGSLRPRRPRGGGANPRRTRCTYGEARGEDFGGLLLGSPFAVGRAGGQGSLHPAPTFGPTVGRALSAPAPRRASMAACSSSISSSLRKATTLSKSLSLPMPPYGRPPSKRPGRNPAQVSRATRKVRPRARAEEYG